MAQSAVPATKATAADAFIEYSDYNGYTIIVSKQFSPVTSELLMQLQVLAIDAHAVAGVEKDTMVNMAAWTTEAQPRPCLHINFRPVLMDCFDYEAFTPLSLVKKGGLVVAGVCVTSLRQISQLHQHLKPIPLTLDEELKKVLERLGSRLATTRIHYDCQDTSNRSSSTTSAIFSPSTLITTTKAREETLRPKTRQRQRDADERDEYAAETSEPKRARTRCTYKLGSESVLIQPKFSSKSTIPDRKDIIHAPTTEIRNPPPPPPPPLLPPLPPLPSTTTKANMMAYLDMDDQAHHLLLREGRKAHDSICKRLNDLSWRDLPVEVKHDATLAMVNEASAETKPYYEKGKWWNNGKEENWVAWWYVYQCYRYKNNRRTKSKKAGAAAPQDSVGGDFELSIEDIQGGDRFPNKECARLPVTEQPERRRQREACGCFHDIKIKCGARFPRQRREELDLECTGWEEKLRWQDMQSPFRPTITSSSTPTVVSDLWIDPGLRVKSSEDAQYGNSMFPEVRQDWIDPLSVSFWNGVLEQAYPFRSPHQSIR